MYYALHLFIFQQRDYSVWKVILGVIIFVHCDPIDVIFAIEIANENTVLYGTG